MHPDPRPSSNRRLLRAMVLSAAALVLATAAHGGGLAINASLIAAGGGRSESSGGCLAVDASIGQDTVGRSQGGPFSVSAGFRLALVGRPADSLFNNGFQECQ